MTSAQRTKSIGILGDLVAVQEHRAKQRRAENATRPHQHLIDAAEMLEANADALRATLALVEHYTPADNSTQETKRIEVPA